jgi:hypothetical protein
MEIRSLELPNVELSLQVASNSSFWSSTKQRNKSLEDSFKAKNLSIWNILTPCFLLLNSDSLPTTRQAKNNVINCVSLQHYVIYLLRKYSLTRSFLEPTFAFEIDTFSVYKGYIYKDILHWNFI